MKRKTSTLPTRVYKYGCGALPSEVRSFLDQLFLANNFYNKLVEIERERRSKEWALYEATPELQQWLAADDKAAAECKEAFQKFKAAEKANSEDQEALERIFHNKKKVFYQARRETLSAIQKHKKSSTELLKDLFPEDLFNKDGEKLQTNAVVKPRLEARAVEAVILWILGKDRDLLSSLRNVRAEANDAIKAARTQCKIADGTYNTVTKAVEQATKTRAKKCLLPAFKSFSKDGWRFLGIQFKDRKMTLENLHSCTSKYLRLEPGPKGNATAPKEIKKRWTVSLRPEKLRSHPKWIRVPIKLHRPLPKDSIIREARLISKKIGLRRKYEVQFVIESEFKDERKQ